MSETSARLQLPFVLSNQAQKHVTVNEGLTRLDALLHVAIEDQNVNSPPLSPNAGQAWLVGQSPIGIWEDEPGKLAVHDASGWRFYTLLIGMIIFDISQNSVMVFTGNALEPVNAHTHHSLQNLSALGINTQSDATHKMAIKADSVLLSHDDISPGSGDVRLSMNKAGLGKTNQIVLQSDWVGRATLGLETDDHFALKTSMDGTNWKSALSISTDGKQVGLPRVVCDDSITISGDTWRTHMVQVASDTAWGQFKVRRARGTLASPSAILSGDTVFSFSPEAYDGGHYVLCGGISYVAESNFANEKSCYFRIATIDDGNWSEKLRIRANGNVGLGTSTPLVKLDVSGAIRPGAATIAELPSAIGIAGAIYWAINVSGGPRLVYSDGSTWRTISDNNILSSS